jgi:hypothetical protein
MVAKELEWVMKNVPGKLGETFLISECQTFAQTAPGPGQEGSAMKQQRVCHFASPHTAG